MSHTGSRAIRISNPAGRVRGCEGGRLGSRARMGTHRVAGDARLVGRALRVVRGHYATFRLARYDLGNMVQAVWSTAHGRPLDVTDGLTGEQMVRLGSHVDPILGVARAALDRRPIAADSSSRCRFSRLRSGRCRSSGLLAAPRVGTAAALLALGYLAYPWTAWTAVDAFHPVTLAIPLLFFAVWFLDSDRLLPFALCAILVACDGRAHGARHCRARASGTRSARGRVRGRAVIFAGACRVELSPCSWSSRRSRADRARTSAPTTRSVGRRQAFSRTRSRSLGSPRAVGRAATSLPRPGCGAARRTVRARSRAGRGRLAAALGQLLAGFARRPIRTPTTWPVLPFLFCGDRIGLGAFVRDRAGYAAPCWSDPVARGDVRRSVRGRRSSVEHRPGSGRYVAGSARAFRDAVAIVPDEPPSARRIALGSHLRPGATHRASRTSDEPSGSSSTSPTLAPAASTAGGWIPRPSRLRQSATSGALSWRKVFDRKAVFSSFERCEG